MPFGTTIIWDLLKQSGMSISANCRKPESSTIIDHGWSSELLRVPSLFSYGIGLATMI